jgi:hypothetical protein
MSKTNRTLDTRAKLGQAVLAFKTDVTDPKAVRGSASHKDTTRELNVASVDTCQQVFEVERLLNGGTKLKQGIEEEPRGYIGMNFDIFRGRIVCIGCCIRLTGIR